MKTSNLMLGLILTALFGVSAQSARAYDVKIDIANGSVILKDIPDDYRASVTPPEGKAINWVQLIGDDKPYIRVANGEIFLMPYARTSSSTPASFSLVLKDEDPDDITSTEINTGDFECDGFYYKIGATGTAELVGTDETLSGCVTVPASVIHDGTEYILSYIKNSSFESRNSITEIRIEPSNIKRELVIEWNAFKNCIQLHTLDLPEDLHSIFPSMIDGCKALCTIINRATTIVQTMTDIPNNLESIINTIKGQGIVMYYPFGSYTINAKYPFWNSFIKKSLVSYDPDKVFSITLPLRDNKGSITLYDVAPGDKMEFLYNESNNSKYIIKLGDRTLSPNDDNTITIPDNLSGNVMLALDEPGPVSAINDIIDEDIPYVIVGNQIEINSPEPLIIIDTLGHQIFEGIRGTITLTTGIYVVRYGSKAHKLIIK